MEKGIGKFCAVLIQIFLFSLVYMLLDDYHFSGINRLEEIIKDEIIQRKIKPFVRIPDESFRNSTESTEATKIKEKAAEIKTDFEQEQVIKKLAKPSTWNKFFNRLYFSFVTGSSLGYGDVAPSSNMCRAITMAQLISSILIILL